jgi:hypothetical protein
MNIDRKEQQIHVRLCIRSNALHAITETNRVYLVLFGMQNRTFGPYLAAIHRILTSASAHGRIRR